MSRFPIFSKEVIVKKTMLILLVFVSVFLSIVGNCCASGWEAVSKDEVSTTYYDSERIEASGQTQTFYTKTEWITSGLLVVKGEYFISKIKLDCSKKTIRLLERQYFDVNGVPGKIENIQNILILKRSEFLEKKIDEDTLFWFKLVCTKNKKP